MNKEEWLKKGYVTEPVDKTLDLKTEIDKLRMEHVTGTVKLKLYKGNIITSSITSPDSLYSEELVTFNESSYDQTNATGFINLWGLPDTVLALREQGKL